jgi:hypothetical protein
VLYLNKSLGRDASEKQLAKVYVKFVFRTLYLNKSCGVDAILVP